MKGRLSQNHLKKIMFVNLFDRMKILSTSPYAVFFWKGWDKDYPDDYEVFDLDFLQTRNLIKGPTSLVKKKELITYIRVHYKKVGVLLIADVITGENAGYTLVTKDNKGELIRLTRKIFNHQEYLDFIRELICI